MNDYKERDNFILRATFWKCFVAIAKMRLKSALQKLNFVIAKAISECYTLDCVCFFYKQHFHKQHQADIGNKLSKS